MNATIGSTPAVAVTTSELLARKISLFSNVNAKTPSTELTIAKLINGIKTGTCKNEVEKLRGIFKSFGKQSYKEARSKSLGCVTISGTFNRRSDDSLKCHSGLIAIDLDDLGENLAATKQKLMHDNTVFCCFVSPSGNGLKVLLPIDAKDQATHRAAYQQILERYQALGMKPDTTCRNPSRLCFVSFDPEIWISPFPSFLLSAPVPAICNLPATNYNLHTTPQTTHAYELTAGVQRLKLLKQLEKDDPIIADLYAKHVSRWFTPEAGKRNEALSQLVPYWFRAVSSKVAEKLAIHDLEINRGLYEGTNDEHLRSLKGLWEGCEKRYPSELSEVELRFYELLEHHEPTAFRIMRDLAKLQKGEPFFMSCDQLQNRIGPSCNGHRLRAKMAEYRIIKPIAPGLRRERGVRGKAATWKWMLPMPVVQPEKAILA